MPISEIPVIRLELDSMRQSIVHAFMTRSEEINDMVKSSVDKTLDDTNFQSIIDASVRNAIHKAVEDLPKNYQAQMAIQEIIVKALEKGNYK